MFCLPCACPCQYVGRLAEPCANVHLALRLSVSMLWPLCRALCQCSFCPAPVCVIVFGPAPMPLSMSFSPCACQCQCLCIMPAPMPRATCHVRGRSSLCQASHPSCSPAARLAASQPWTKRGHTCQWPSAAHAATTLCRWVIRRGHARFATCSPACALLNHGNLEAPERQALVAILAGLHRLLEAVVAVELDE